MKKTLLLGITIIFVICTALTSFAAPVGAPIVTVKDAANDIANRIVSDYVEAIDCLIQKLNNLTEIEK